jgi:hypothetical protein
MLLKLSGFCINIFHVFPHRINGVPKYQIPEEDLGFSIGGELTGKAFKGWSYHRKKAEY